MSRRGFALPAVLFGLLLLAAVVVGAWLAAWQSVVHAELAAAEARLRWRAGAALAEAVTGWDARLDSLSPGSAARLSPLARVTRTGLNTFVVVSDTADGRGARAALRDLLRLRPLFLDGRAVARLQLGPGALAAQVEGRDTPPAGWTCPATTDSITTVTIQLSDTSSRGPGIGSGWTWQSLVGWTMSLPAGGDSLPWRFVAGDTTLAGSRFTGVLVVGGSVTLRSGAEVIGLVIASGSIVFEGLGGAISGQVVARDLQLSPGTLLGAASIIYSSCAVRAVARSRAPVRTLPGIPPSDVY